MYKEPAESVALGRIPLCYMRIWQVLGLCPISVHLETTTTTTKNFKRRNSLPIFLWSSIQLLLFSALHAHTIYNYKCYIFSGDKFGMFNDILKLLSTVIAYSVTLVECLWRRRELRQFLQLYAKLHRSWLPPSAVGRNRFDWTLYRRLHLCFAFGICVMFAVEGVYAWGIRQRRQWISFFLGFMPGLTICRLRLIQYVCYLDLLRLEIVHLDAEVKRLQQRNVTPHKIILELPRLMRVYMQLYEMSQLLCASTGYSLVAIYVTSYIKLLSDCYWTYWVVYNKDDVLESILILATLLNVTLLLLSSGNCMRAADILAHNVHKIRIPADNLDLAKRLQHFGLLLRHQPIVYDALGFFIVNCTLISAMLASITTYMTFFVQFMPKFQNL